MNKRQAKIIALDIAEKLINHFDASTAISGDDGVDLSAEDEAKVYTELYAIGMRLYTRKRQLEEKS